MDLLQIHLFDTVDDRKHRPSHVRTRGKGSVTTIVQTALFLRGRVPCCLVIGQIGDVQAAFFQESDNSVFETRPEVFEKCISEPTKNSKVLI